MIKTLHITNYALIDEIDIEFAPGFNIITGETGAGKSIILGALALLLGGRADTKVIRQGEKKSVIEAVFDSTKPVGVNEVLAANDIDSLENGEIILRRELAPGGRSRAFINDTPVKLPLLREVAEKLIDIHSQHENQALTRSDYQLGIIDSLAGNDELLNAYHKAYAQFREALKEYTDTRDMIRRNRDDADFIQFQYEQLAALDLEPGEHEKLENEREVLSNIGDLKESITQALDPLVNSSENVLSLLSQTISAVRELADTLNDSDTDFLALADRLDSARIELSDVADSLERVDSGIAADPERLVEIEQRLSDLYSLELKHHVDNSDGLIELRDRLNRQLEALENADNVLAGLEMKAKRAKKTAWELAEKLSERRADAAGKFASILLDRAKPLGMANLQCEIAISRGKLQPEGIDSIEFLFAFNKNQTPVPVGASASGGEISRLMLTVKSIIASSMNLPTIVFDEVDVGVSGDIAGRMGATMADIANNIQVITITHLPGVAALGQRHFKVFKEDDETSTNTRIRCLSDAERERELALMISGDADSDTAIANARVLLQNGKKLSN